MNLNQISTIEVCTSNNGSCQIVQKTFATRFWNALRV
jgi:hypothetical protein